MEGSGLIYALSRHLPGGLGKSRTTSVRIAEVPSEIRTNDHLDTSLCAVLRKPFRSFGNGT
jgi:hypothetical protein